MSCLPVFLLAQEEQEVKGAHPYKTEENKEVAQEYAHWSITPHLGFNFFDGDFNSEMKHAVSIPNAGLSVEYAFTPVWEWVSIICLIHMPLQVILLSEIMQIHF
jgi:hypothetical protein